MKKILLPLEETERSLKALQYAKNHYSPEEAEFVLLMTDEKLGFSVKSEAESDAMKEIEDKLRLIGSALEGYKVTLASAVGKAGLKITRCAKETGCDLIIMCKSSQEDMRNSVGRTTEYVINNAPCEVLIVSESLNSRNEYRGLIYKTATGSVTLRGQLGAKQSECLLPSVNQDCIYHIEVTVGRIRFFHTAYNPDTRNWDLPPVPGQEVTLDMVAGETRDILVKADSTDGKADRIRIVNRDMKKEAVFTFRISAADSIPAPEPEKARDMVKEAIESRATIEMERVHEPAIPEDFVEPEIPVFMPDHAPKEPAPEPVPVPEPEPEAEPDPLPESIPLPGPVAEAAQETGSAPAPEPTQEPVHVQEPEPAPESDPEPEVIHMPGPVTVPAPEPAPAPEREPEPDPEPLTVPEIPVFVSEPEHTPDDRADDPSGEDTGALFTVEFH